MTCPEVEILLCDYLEGTLPHRQGIELEEHLAVCSACAELARDVEAATAFLDAVPAAEPPAELLTRILHQAPRGAQTSEERRPWWRRLFGGWVEGVLQPRYAMGMAMTVLSLAMLARFAHIEPRPLRASDLDPARVWQSIDDHSHRVWDRTMKYYDNLRLVIEIQSRLKEWSDQEQPADAGASQATTSGHASGKTSGAAPAQTPVQTNDKR
jgi:anti-sigma factor RsiW